MANFPTIDECILPTLGDFEQATYIADRAFNGRPIDQTDLKFMAQTFLRLRAFVEEVHIQAVQDGINGNDFYENVTDLLEGAGFNSAWRGHMIMDADVPRR